MRNGPQSAMQTSPTERSATTDDEASTTPLRDAAMYWYAHERTSVRPKVPKPCCQLFPSVKGMPTQLTESSGDWATLPPPAPAGAGATSVCKRT